MMKTVLFVVLSAMPLFAAHGDDLKTVGSVDLNQYVGDWYQVGGIPQEFDKDCVCTRQQLALEATGTVNVRNTCNVNGAAGPLKEIIGTATVADPATNAKLLVDFGMPEKGDYWIIGLDSQYRYAVVSDPSKNTLFILSKTPQLDSLLNSEALAIALEQGIDVTKVQTTNQEGCTYP